jgi:sporulation protein YlmC with PRC-barrel domain
MEAQVLSASTLMGDDVRNPQGENLGELEEIMLDCNSGRIAYAVISFGGILGMGDKLFAIPWEALRLDTENKVFFWDEDPDRLEDAPGFDKDDWPRSVDHEYLNEVHDYYGYDSYWK